ncbi:hypothetical protein GTW43_05730 [Streptomyces sp. SID5785]|uniref:hypothetical protein n=1 Tax=Streptomyces sp. SID5785 TaxID=2690309 RepID=UPI00136104A2|nr:hypothetical protein [Streptomyces sp. SID5785]MZD04583.1 hypothetical protein [Streptomyces sp. SID5785]
MSFTRFTVRGTLAVVAGCAAAAAGGAAPAAAAPSVPVEVPLAGVESALPVDAPELRTAAPLPIPGAPEGPRYDEQHLLPQNALPRLPVSSELPRTHAALPVPRVLPVDTVEQVGLDSAGSPLRTESPGASVGAPLTAPQAGRFGLPGLSTPQLGLGTPDLQAGPGADLGLGS